MRLGYWKKGRGGGGGGKRPTAGRKNGEGWEGRVGCMYVFIVYTNERGRVRE